MYVLSIETVLAHEIEVGPKSRPTSRAHRRPLTAAPGRPTTSMSCRERPTTGRIRPRTSKLRPKTAFAKLTQTQEHVQGTQDIGRPQEGDNMGLMGSSVRYTGTQSKATWSMADSQTRVDSGHMQGTMQGNTPRILELDINRMMIGQNTISAQIPGLSNDRLVNASNNNLRSYMTVNRPTGPVSAGKSDRPTSGSRIQESPVPPSSPTSRSASTTKRVRLSDIEVPSVMTTSQPLPPIGSSPTPGRSTGSGKGRRSPTRIPVGEVSPSPPGSRDSIRQSPVEIRDNEMTSPVK